MKYIKVVRDIVYPEVEPEVKAEVIILLRDKHLTL